MSLWNAQRRRVATYGAAPALRSERSLLPSLGLRPAFANGAHQVLGRSLLDGRVDAEVSGDVGRAAGPTKTQHCQPGSRADVTLLLLVRSSSGGLTMHNGGLAQRGFAGLGRRWRAVAGTGWRG